MLELAEVSLDRVPQLVERGEEAPGILAVPLVRDVRADAPLGEGGGEAIRVVGLVGEQDRVLGDGLDEVGGRGEGVGLARRERQRDDVALAVGEGVQLGGQPAARAAGFFVR